MKILKNKKMKSLIILVFSSSITLLLFKKSDILSALTDREYPSYRIIGLMQAKERFDEGTHLFLDAREDIFYQIGHIKNSLNFPPEDFDQMINDFEKKYTKYTKIVIYCDGSDCSTSFTLAERLIERGYIEIEVFFGGWTDWINSSLPIEQNGLSSK